MYSLTPFLDDRGILRDVGRLEEATLAYDARHPMFLAYNDPIVKLILGMINLLLATARRKYWIFKGKAMARNIVKDCVRSARAKPNLYNQIMENFPPYRVTLARPFILSIVDYCGPLWVHYKYERREHTSFTSLYLSASQQRL